MIWNIKRWLKKKDRRHFLEDMKNPEAKEEREIKELMIQWGSLMFRNKNMEAKDVRMKMIELEVKKQLRKKKK